MLWATHLFAIVSVEITKYHEIVVIERSRANTRNLSIIKDSTRRTAVNMQIVVPVRRFSVCYEIKPPNPSQLGGIRRAGGQITLPAIIIDHIAPSSLAFEKQKLVAGHMHSSYAQGCFTRSE